MQKINFHIRPALLCDLEILTHISESTFRAAFEADNDPGDFEAYMRTSMSREAIQREWEDANNYFFLLDVNGESVGYVKLRGGKQPPYIKKNDAVELQRIYVRKDKQSLGLGKELFLFAVNQAKTMQAKVIWLGVWEHNYGAIRFYERIGMTKYGSHIFQLGEDKQTDLIMSMEI